MVPGLDRATELVIALCGGTAARARVAGGASAQAKVVTFPLSEVRRLTGIEVPSDEILAILTRLGFAVSGSGETVSVTVPSWRPDVDGKADLVEEVMRIHGVDRVRPAALPRTARSMARS